jgi:hypothetical protein
VVEETSRGREEGNETSRVGVPTLTAESSALMSPDADAARLAALTEPSSSLSSLVLELSLSLRIRNDEDDLFVDGCASWT